MGIFRTLLWRWRMNKVRHGMSPAEVARRLGRPSRNITSGNVDIWSYDLTRIRGMLHAIRVAFINGKASQIYVGIEDFVDEGRADRLPSKSAPEPFMEFPNGEYANQFEALEDAIKRLRALPNWDQWITFCAQGENPARPDTIKFVDLRLYGDQLSAGDYPPDVEKMSSVIGTDGASCIATGRHFSVGSTSTRDLAQQFDAIFRSHFPIPPGAEPVEQYSVGAEW